MSPAREPDQRHLRKEAYAGLKRGFTATDIYDRPREAGFREALALVGLGVSRTFVPKTELSVSSH